METAGGTGSYPTAASLIAYGPLHFVGIEALTADRWADGYLAPHRCGVMDAACARAQADDDLGWLQKDEG
jgi:hypothetical protein